MRKLFILLLLAPACFAQSPVTVTGTITDAGNNPAVSGYVQFDVTPKISGVHYFVAGVGTITQTVQCGINASGQIKSQANLANPCTVWGNDVITPANTQYKITLAPNGNITNVISGECITGSAYSLSSPVFCPIIQLTPEQVIIRTNPFAVNIMPVANATGTIGGALQQWGSGYFSNLFIGGVTVPSLATNNTWTGINIFNAAVTFNSGLIVPVGQIATLNGALNVSLTGDINLSGQFFVGTTGQFFAGGYCLLGNGQTIANSITAGCTTIDDRAGLGSRAIGTVDPGAGVVVTILLGPFNNYTINQLTVRTGLKLIGTGFQEGATFRGTTITSINASNLAPFVLPQANNAFAEFVTLESFNLVGASGNTTQDGLQFDCSAWTNSGLWNSTLRDIFIAQFGGAAVHFKGKNNLGQAENQKIDLYNIHAIRPVSSTSFSMVMEGNNESIMIHNGNFDLPFGAGPGSPGTNILVQTIGTGFPDSIVFDGVHSQFSAVAMQFNGCVSCAVIHCHYEFDFGDILLTNTATQANRGMIIRENWFISGMQNGGNGYILKNTDTATDALFADNTVYNAPDNVIIGTNLASVKVRDNMFASVVPNTLGYSGTTTQLNSTATIITAGAHSIYLNSGGTAVSTINSELGPGEYITFTCVANFCTFTTGGNINWAGLTTPLVLAANETVSFQRLDILTGLAFQYIGTSSAALNGKILGSPTINEPNLLITATNPTIAAGGCGGTVAAINNANGTASFNIFTGTAPTSGGCTITMPAATTNWHCEASHTSAISTTNFVIQQTGALSTTSVTLQLFSDVAAATAPAASDTWRTTCTAN